MSNDSIYLNVLVGVPASGKSTAAYNLCGIYGKKAAIHISRDEIRNNLLKREDKFFDKEDQVYSTFINAIKEACNYYKYIFVDATHLNVRSRKKLLYAINNNNKNVILNFYVFTTPLNVCLKHNSEREGRALVPEETIRQMAKSFQFPTYKEFKEFEDKYKEINIYKMVYIETGWKVERIERKAD